jgi:hypothetical protein
VLLLRQARKEKPMAQTVQTRTVVTTVKTKTPRKLPVKEAAVVGVAIALVAIGRASR